MGEVQLREGLLYGRRLQYSEGLHDGACCWSTDGYPGTVRVSIMELAAGENGAGMDGWVNGCMDGYPGTVRVSIMELAAGVWGGDGW